MQFNINSNLISCLLLVSLACTLSISMVSCQEKREMSQDFISPFLFNNKRAERISASIDPLSGFSPIGKRDQNNVQDQLKALQKVNDFLREIYGSHDPLPPIRPFDSIHQKEGEDWFFNPESHKPNMKSFNSKHKTGDEYQ